MRAAFFLLFSFVAVTAIGQDLKRKAIIGGVGEFTSSGLAVDSVVAGSTMEGIGVFKGDLITKVNGKVISDASTYNAAVSNIREGDVVIVELLRKNKSKRLQGKATMKPFETSELADVIYDWVPFRKGKLRAITRKPKGKVNVPAILLIPGYNCGSIENFSSGYNGKLMNEWLRNGFAVVTVEKSGLGDSFDCVPCIEADLQTDIESFDAAYLYMENLSFVDKQNLFIWGHSMGGVIAPEIARNHSPKGVIVFATVFRPWSEFLLEMHRVQYPLDGKSFEETEAFVRKMQKVYYEFFVEKKSPAKIHEQAELASIVESELEYKEGNTNMWGRHWRYWQQIDSLNLAKSWSEVKCPVLSIFGGADFIACSAVEHYFITETVNTAHPGNCTHITIPDIDHLMVRNKDMKEANKNFSDVAYRNANFNYRIADETISWIKSVLLK